VTETNVFQFSQPGTFADPLTEVLRNGARALLSQAVEAEVAALLACHADKLTDDGRQRLVRHGHLPEREIMTGIGPVPVRCPRVRDRVGEGSDRIRFSSAILPPYARRSKSLEVLIPNVSGQYQPSRNGRGVEQIDGLPCSATSGHPNDLHAIRRRKHEDGHLSTRRRRVSTRGKTKSSNWEW